MENREHDNDYKYTCSYFLPLHCLCPVPEVVYIS